MIGESFILMATVNNAGYIACDMTTLIVYFSTNIDVNSDDEVLGMIDIPNLSAGESSTYTFNVSTPTIAGTNYYRACISHFPLGREESIDNNCSESISLIISNLLLRNVYNVGDEGNLELDGAISVTTAEIGENHYLFVEGSSDNGVSAFVVNNNGNLRNVQNILDNDHLKLSV